MKPHHILVLWSAACIVLVCSAISDNVLGTGEPQRGSLRLIGNNGRNHVRRPRPSLSAPPYAVPMEPVFKYSQRDPLYDKGSVTNISSVEATSISSKADYDVDQTKNIIKFLPFLNKGQRRPTNPKPSQHHRPPPHHHHYPYYPEPPEPIIEIIIKESNISLPAPTTTPPPPTTKEPIHVFYVKYKKNPNPSDHEDEIIYEEPVPALTPHATEIVEGEQPNYGPTYAEPVATPAPPPSTTLRTIIRPDSETYHGSGLKVTFGRPEHHSPQEVYGQSAPQPQIALPEEKDDEIEEPEVTNTNHYTKRQQGPYLQKEVRRDPPTYQLQQSEQLQFREEVPLQPPPIQHINHRFPGPSNQKFFNREITRISNQQQKQQQQQQPQLLQNHQTGFLFHNGQQNIRLTSTAATQPTQHNDRSFIPPTQFLQPTSLYHKQQFEPTGTPRQRLPSPTTVTEQQIQEYQRHKEYLIQQNAKQQQALGALQGQLSSQVPSTINPSIYSTNYQTNQQISNQQIRAQPQIHVEQSPIIDQSSISLRPNPLVENFRLSTNNQNIEQQQFKFDDSNYGQRLREKSNTNTDKRIEQFKAEKEQLYPSQGTNNYNGEGKTKVPDSEIIKSISSLEDHQVQPAPSFNSNRPVNPTVSTQNYNFNNQPTESIYRIRNPQRVNIQSTPQTATNVRFNSRNENEQGRKQNYNVPSSEATYTFKNSQYTSLQENLNNGKESENEKQSEKTNINKYLTVYSRPQNLQQRRTTAAPTRNDPPSSYSPSTEPPREQNVPGSEEEEDKKETEEEEARKKANIAALPDEVPEDLREQLLSSGILGNADIQILDYDKVGDIPIESLPPEALENFYGAASDPVPSVVKPDNDQKAVEMRVVRYDPNSDDEISNKYFQENATKIDPVFLNDSKYKRYLPLKVSGAQFPIPDVPQLKDRFVNSVVVLAPVDYDFIKTDEDSNDSRRGRIIQIQGVKFVVGDSLMKVIREPTQENYKTWLQNELSVPSERQSVVLLVTKGEGENADREEIFMYEIEKKDVRKLRGELSSTFVELANSNSQSEDLERLGGDASESQTTQ